MISASEIETAFPEIVPGVKPLGARVLVQLRTVRKKTGGGILIVEETKEFNKSITQLAKVVALGPIAFCNRDTMKPWPEGVWVQKGDLVRVPKYGGDRFERVIPGSGGEETAIFCTFQDHEILSIVDPEVFAEIDDMR
jgi:co-chaperonin GroES (HSP10)